MVDTTKATEGKYVNADMIKNSPTKKGVIIDEGEFVEGQFGEKFQLTIELDGKQKVWSPNKDSLLNIHDKMGKDSKFWVGTIIKFRTTIVKGKHIVIGEVTE